MDWFERLSGFVETGYEDTRARLAVEGRELVSLATGQRYGIGELELVSLGSLRDRAKSLCAPTERSRVRIVRGDARRLHQEPQYASALFQVASQFNLLEMVSPDITPEHGVTRYQSDPTQGPACAIAAGAATVYRNYFAPVGAEFGQTRDRQLDGLADLGLALSGALAIPVGDLWSMRNGYALCTLSGLAAIEGFLKAADEAEQDRLRALLRIGLHWKVEVSDAPGTKRPTVSQAFCSGLPIAYTRIPAIRWQSFARLVLEAAYEATLLAGALHGQRGGSKIVLLTRLGGGAFGNEDNWIDAAIRRAIRSTIDYGLDVRIVSFSSPSAPVRALERDFG